MHAYIPTPHPEPRSESCIVAPALQAALPITKGEKAGLDALRPGLGLLGFAVRGHRTNPGRYERGAGPPGPAQRALLFSPWCGNKCVTHCNHDHPSLARQRIETCAPGLDHFWLGRRTGIAGMGATASVGLLR